MERAEENFIERCCEALEEGDIEVDVRYTTRTNVCTKQKCKT